MVAIDGFSPTGAATLHTLKTILSLLTTTVVVTFVDVHRTMLPKYGKNQGAVGNKI
jgi:hypothetical protein